jgi:glucokinase
VATLLADVGGTNVRFAVLSAGSIGPIEHIRVADHPHFDDALAAYLKGRGDRDSIREAIFAVAGVVHGERCKLTNNDWVVDAAALRARFGFVDVHLTNDFEAVAWSLPHLKSKDLRQLGGGTADQGAPMLAIGPGTGLGVAAYVPRGKSDQKTGQMTGLALMSEGGHTTLPSGSVREDAIIAALRRDLGYVSAESILSGPGLERLYSTIATLDGATVPGRPAREITKAGIDGTCPVSRAALDTFCAMLGEVAGNFALAFGAQGGVFIGGGFVPRMRDYLPGTQLRARFDAKGRMSAYVAAIPVYLILHDDPAFIGLQSLARVERS